MLSKTRVGNGGSKYTLPSHRNVIPGVFGDLQVAGNLMFQQDTPGLDFRDGTEVPYRVSEVSRPLLFEVDRLVAYIEGLQDRYALRVRDENARAIAPVETLMDYESPTPYDSIGTWAAIPAVIVDDDSLFNYPDDEPEIWL